MKIYEIIKKNYNYMYMKTRCINIDILVFIIGDGLVDGYEFENDAWIFDDDFDDDGKW